MVICLKLGADLYMAQLMLLPLTVSCASVKSRLVLPYWYWLTWIVPEKGPLNVCVCVCVCVCVRACVLYVCMCVVCSVVTSSCVEVLPDGLLDVLVNIIHVWLFQFT